MSSLSVPSHLSLQISKRTAKKGESLPAREVGGDEIQAVFQGNMLSEKGFGPAWVIPSPEISGDKGFWKVQAGVAMKVCIRIAALTSCDLEQLTALLPTASFSCTVGMKPHLAGLLQGCDPGGPRLAHGRHSVNGTACGHELCPVTGASCNSSRGAILVAVECRT